MRMRIAKARVAPNVGYNKPFDSRELNPVIIGLMVRDQRSRGITSQGGIVHYESPAFMFFLKVFHSFEC